MVRQTPPISCPLHPHLRFLDQPGGTLVRRNHQQANSTRRVPQREGVETAIREYIDVHNENPKPFVWTKTADRILASIARFAQRTCPSQPSELTSRITGTGD